MRRSTSRDGSLFYWGRNRWRCLESMRDQGRDESGQYGESKSEDRMAGEVPQKAVGQVTVGSGGNCVSGRDVAVPISSPLNLPTSDVSLVWGPRAPMVRARRSGIPTNFAFGGINTCRILGPCTN